MKKSTVSFLARIADQIDWEDVEVVEFTPEGESEPVQAITLYDLECFNMLVTAAIEYATDESNPELEALEAIFDKSEFSTEAYEGDDLKRALFF